jgi:hypothetical protein
VGKQRRGFLIETKELFAFHHFTLIPNNFLVIMLAVRTPHRAGKAIRFPGRAGRSIGHLADHATAYNAEAKHKTRNQTIFDWRTSSESF